MNKWTFIDWVNIISLIIGLQNLQENEEQSAKTLELLRQNDVDRANDKQADLLLSALSAQFEAQNKMLAEILQILRGNEND